MKVQRATRHRSDATVIQLSQILFQNTNARKQFLVSTIFYVICSFFTFDIGAIPLQVTSDYPIFAKHYLSFPDLPSWNPDVS